MMMMIINQMATNKQKKQTQKKINAQKRHTNTHTHTHKISHQPIWLRPKKKKKITVHI